MDKKKCQTMGVKCFLKNGTPQKTTVKGDCENGWTVNATDPNVWENRRTKLFCKSDTAKAKWHFYIYPMGNLSRGGGVGRGKTGQKKLIERSFASRKIGQ